MDVAVLIPYRPDGGRRDALLEYVLGWWAKHLPDWLVVLGWEAEAGSAEPFNRSAALNHAVEVARRTRPVRAVVVADADTIPGDARRVAHAASRAAVLDQLTFPFTRYHYVGAEGTDRLLAGDLDVWELGTPRAAGLVDWSMESTGSSCLAVSVDLWDRVGGFDPGFVGWGYEDAAFSLACQTIGPSQHRLAGDVWHLEHPTQEGAGNVDHPGHAANRARCALYEAAFHRPPAMRALLRELGVLPAVTA